MDLTKYDFEKLDVRFTDKLLLAEAEERGFFSSSGKYNKLFSELFFNGGTLNWKKDIDPEFRMKAGTYLIEFMGGWESKHEEKEAICALLLSELVDIK